MSGSARTAVAALALAALFGVLGPTVPAAAVGGRGAAGSSDPAGASRPSRAPAQPPAGSLPGMDISHWQGDIDWTRVATSGRTFVFAKATEGQRFDDPMYSTYRAGAAQAGLAFGAYHFAKPDGSVGDAILEADHFVDVAQLGPGNLLPVLDIEVSGGLDPTQLTAWALVWLGEVQARLGVRPMVYTSPNGWTNRFGDSTAIADAGYPLWIAHWGVATPTLPASGWGGRGWLFWQHTDCGRVSGIQGCVDLDWRNGPDLGGATIRQLSVTVPVPVGVVTSSPAAISCGTTCVSNFDPGTVVTLTAAPNTGAVFLGWDGACSGTGSCTVTMDADRAVTANFTTDVTPPTAELVAPPGLTAPVSVSFSEMVHQVSTSNVVVRAEGGDANLPASLTCRSSEGARVPCSTGKVASAELQPTGSLVPGQRYTATVDPAGAAPIVDRAGNAAPTTSIDFGTATEVEQGSAAVRSTWPERRASAAFGGSYVAEHLAGASVSFGFRGRKVTWYSAAGPTQGKALVLIDGRSRGTFNGYASTARFRVAHAFRVLRPGEHTITVRALGVAGSPRATGQLVTVDAFAVGSDVTKTPTLDESWRTVRASRASGGSYAVADLAGASTVFTFRGTGVDWQTIRGRDQGRARVYVDGTLVRTVDNYAARTTFGVVRGLTGLTDGVHTLRIVVVGEGRKSATGTGVAIDRFVVRAAPVP